MIDHEPRAPFQREPWAMPDPIVILVILAAIFLAVGTTWRLWSSCAAQKNGPDDHFMTAFTALDRNRPAIDRHRSRMLPRVIGSMGLSDRVALPRIAAI
jgi:hypothetical protein